MHFSPVRKLLFLFPVHIDKENHIHNYPDSRRHRCCQTDLCQAGVWLDTHHISERQTYQKCLDQALRHNPYRLIISVKISDHAEKDCSHNGFCPKSSQILKSSLDNCYIRGKESCKQISLKHHQYKYNTSYSQSDSNSCKQRMFRSFYLSGSDVLRYERSHGLHQGTWYQHDKIYDLACNTITGGCFQAEPVVNGRFFFIRMMTAKTTLHPCAITVAIAAPAASI